MNLLNESQMSDAHISAAIAEIENIPVFPHQGSVFKCCGGAKYDVIGDDALAHQLMIKHRVVVEYVRELDNAEECSASIGGKMYCQPIFYPLSMVNRAISLMIRRKEQDKNV